MSSFPFEREMSGRSHSLVHGKRIIHGTEVVTIDDKTFEIIGDSLRRLDNWDDPITDCDMWMQTLCLQYIDEYSDDERRTIHWSQEEKIHFRKLDRVVDALQAIQASAIRLKKERHARMRTRYMSEGLDSLPDDLLVKILTLAGLECQRYRRYKDVLQLASVCRRFRDVVFSQAQFWTRLDDTFHPNIVDIALRRSREASLSTRFVNAELSDQSIALMRKLQGHFHRVTSLRLWYFDGHIRSWKTTRTLLTELARTELPALKKFEMCAPAWEDHGVLDGQISPERDDDLFHPYTKWVAPSLRQLMLEELLPRVHAGLALTSIDLSFSRQWHTPVRPMSKLMSFLKSQPTLETIDLCIQYLPEPDFCWEETINLPKLRRLAIEGRIRGASAIHSPSVYLIPTIIRCLHLPVVRFMYLDIPVRDSNFTLESMFPGFQEYPEVTRLRLDLSHSRELSLEVSPFTTIFTKFPLLNHLDISSLDAIVRWDVPSVSFNPPPPLRNLILSNFDCFNKDDLGRVLEYLSRCPRWDEFKALRIVSHQGGGRVPKKEDIDELADRFALKDKIHVDSCPY